MSSQVAATSSPQWDSRGSPFISPTRLQELRASRPPTHNFTTNSQPTSNSPPNNQSHARSSSFFSFRKHPSQLNSDLHRSSSRSNPNSTSMANGNGQAPEETHLSSSEAPPASPPNPPPLHPEIRSVVQLTVAHAHKIYFSGPLVRRIEREPNGHKPLKDEGWTEVWAQLGGTTLSIWDMRKIQEASQQGKEVPPTYVNMTDAFVQVLGSVTVPATPTTPAQRYSNVLTLNTAGSNLLLFSCPSTAALISWAAALRLSAWEKSRLEEIYTAHLIRITLSARDIPTTLVRNRLEGWVRIRIAGQTDWKLVWMVISAGAPATESDELGRVISNGGNQPTNAGATRKKRMSSLFSRDSNSHAYDPASPRLPSKPSISMFASPKPKDRKKTILSMSDISQAFAVYPERPELITRSTLMKIEGLFGEEETAGSMHGREGWLLVMPQLEGGLSQAAEMLKWIIAFHDAFKLYGRPQAWTWDPRDSKSLMFAYPVGPHKDLLFLDREQAETLDPRDERTSLVRSRLLSLLSVRMREAMPSPQAPVASGSGSRGDPPSDTPPSLPPIGSPGNGPQLPPLSFDGISSQPQDRALLTPITERSSVFTHGGTISGGGRQSVLGPSPVPEEPAPSPPASPSVSPSGQAEMPSGQPSKVPGEPHSASPTRGMVNLPSESSPTPRPPEKDRFSPTSRQSHDSGSLSNSRPSGMSAGRASFDSFSNAAMTVNTSSPASNLPASNSNLPNIDAPRSPVSILTSPHSNADHPSGSASPGLRGGALGERASILTSPYSPVSSPMAQNPPLRPPSEDGHELSSEAALYYMAQFDREPQGRNAAEPGPSHQAPRRMPTTIAEDEKSERSSDEAETRVESRSVTSPVSSASVYSNQSPVVRNSTPMAFIERSKDSSNSVPEDRLTSPNAASRPGLGLGLGRKPSGARAQQQASSSRFGHGHETPPASALVGQQVPEEDSEGEEDYDQDMMDAERDESSAIPSSTASAVAGVDSSARAVNSSTNKAAAFSDDDNLDVLAALSYLDVSEQPPPPPPQQGSTEPLHPRAGAASPSSGYRPAEGVSATSASAGTAQYRSSFAPSSKAAERKAKAQAAQAAQAAAAHRPGARTTNTKRKMRAVPAGGTDAWNASSEEDDEEEEEEEEEDDEVDSDAEPTSKPASGAASSNQSVRPNAAGINVPNTNGGDASDAQFAYSHLRPRTLPQIPAGGVPGGRMPIDGDDYPAPVPRQYSDAGRRTYFEDSTPVRTQAEVPQPGAARQSMWSQVLDPHHTPGTIPETPANGRETFVQLEPAAQTMTKAFTPQGLLSAGMQDKQGRSAKRQEELARESGASLINVPNKPPPPQTGLLGAITAHERERKREGGMGAALTEREREKRLAEERQRRFDEHQRQQLDQMQQGGSMYGGFNPMMGMGMNPMMMGMNPMMTGGGMGMNPMMTGGGMNPMMTGGGMNPMMTGYGGMMPGFNPQHMFAAQQAAQAYQQAMMAFSVAGSQAGGEGGGSPGIAPLNPMMSGNGMGAFDPRMSMMSMPMMGGMGMGMQMTGMSQFDPRFGPNNGNTPSPMNDPGLVPPGGLSGQNNFHSNNSSPVRRGSPLARLSNDHAESARNSSRPTSPKP